MHGEMRKAAGKDVGELVVIEIAFDPEKRVVSMHPKFRRALNENPEAKKVFETLSPSRKQEIHKYFSFLKTEESVDRNIDRSVQFLLGRERFMGRDTP